MGKRQQMKEPTIYCAPRGRVWVVWVDPQPATIGEINYSFITRSEAVAYTQGLSKRFGWRFMVGGSFERGGWS